MSSKALLKAVGDAIKQQKYDDAYQKALEVLKKDPKNYQAHIFLAFALDKKDKLDEAEKIYLGATELKPGEAQAWQGLIRLYERQGPSKLPGYQHAALNLAGVFRDANDMHRCQETMDKFVDFARAHGDRLQYADALGAILPGSPIYPALEGRVPHPGRTYETIAQILETEEKKRINTLIGERRTRIGARVAEVTLEVKTEVFRASRLADVYEQLINWTTDDDNRRKYEEKLFLYRHERLTVFPPGPEKAQELVVVQKLADGMVIIKHPLKLAWDIAIDWKDPKDIKEFDVNILRDYCSLFIDSDLSKVLLGYLGSEISPFPKTAGKQESSAVADGEDESEDDDDGGGISLYPETEEDCLVMILDGIGTADSLLAYRLAGEYYQHSEEHEDTVELMRKAMEHLAQEQKKTGLSFSNTGDAYKLFLGTALVFYQSPRNHTEAKSLFDSVLAHDKSSTPALLGVGLIYEEEEEYEQAIDFLERAFQRDSENLRIRTEAAWVKALKGDYAGAKPELETSIPLIKAKGAASRDLLAQTQYRLGICIWNLDASKEARKSRQGAYALWLDALRNDINFAPPYTSLGIYYADYAKDKKRARRSFLKAVELSPSEVVAAERLARSFADDGDWDRVELVAQRIVDSGKVRPPPGSKRKGISWPFAALGVAQLNKQDFNKAIVSFQAALRISPNEYHSWVGLAESYHNAGRYIAATKAVLNARKLEDTTGFEITGDTWFTKFLLANIRRQLGEYDEAIDLYRAVVETRPDEKGVATALMQTMVESSFSCLDGGFYGKAITLAQETIKFALQVREAISDTFNFWRAVGDACSLFSSIQSRVTDFPNEEIQALIGKDDQIPEYQTFKDVDGVGTGVIFAHMIFPDDEMLGVDLTRSLHASILAHKRAIYVSAHDSHAQAIAYYNLGWAEYRAHICLPADLRTKASRYMKAALRCFKRAIELEARNFEFWNALGVVTSEVNPAIAQHSFVRSLYLNERSAQTWTNLGVLALLHNDAKLANHALTRAQSTDPDYAHAWLGQGLVALLFGDPKEARGLFTHAMDIANASSVATRRHYSVSMFDHVLSSPPNVPITTLIQAVFSLSQVQALRPLELAFAHLGSLFQERTQDINRAVPALEHVTTSLEADYEATESSKSLKHFALAKTDLARAYYAASSFAKAIEAGEMALQLSSDESDNELTPEERRKARLSAHLTVGLAHYFAGDAGEAVTFFDAVLEESDGNPDAACVLAQVLWATNSEDARERARNVLFEVIEKTPDHVQSVVLLGVISLLDNDMDSVEAVLESLHALRAGQQELSATEQAQISDVLAGIAALVENTTEQEVLAQIQTDIMMHPYLPHGWSSLAAVAGDEGEDGGKFASEMALRVARKGVPPLGELGAEDLAKAYAGTGVAADAQVAVMLAPWEAEGWIAFADALSF